MIRIVITTVEQTGKFYSAVFYKEDELRDEVVMCKFRDEQSFVDHLLKLGDVDNVVIRTYPMDIS